MYGGGAEIILVIHWVVRFGSNQDLSPEADFLSVLDVFGQKATKFSSLREKSVFKM